MEQSTTLQHVLNKGKGLLDKGDVQGYWTLMSKHSGYARLAGEVTSGKGFFAHIANARLQRAAKKNLGRELSKDEMSKIRLKIAEADRDTRSKNLETEGHIGVSGKDTVAYHTQVFEDKGLPEDTYTPAHLQNIAGAYWSKVTGTPTHDVKDKELSDSIAEMNRRFEADPKGYMDELGSTGIDLLTTGMDAAEFIGDDKTLTSPFGVGHDPLEKTVGPGDDGEPTPQSGSNGPTGQDDGADDDEPSSGPSDSSSSDSSSGAGQPQSARLPDPDADPNANSEIMELKPGEEGKNQTMEIKPEQRKLMDDISKTDGPLDEILAKDPRNLTEGEFVELKKEVLNLPAGPEQNRLDGMATAFLEHRFGDGPAKFDAVGRMIDPEPIRPINDKPVPARTPDGEPLTGVVGKIGGVIADAAGGEDRTSAVQDLQSGLNLLKSIMQRRAKSSSLAAIHTTDLKTDGVVGPKTRRALRLAATTLGRPKIEEGFALGRFGNFARGIQSGRADTRSLKPTIDKAFGPLFRDPQSSRQSPSRPAEENLSFQATINDLGSDVFGREAFKPIREDGLIGPRTESAFNAVLPAAGPDRFTSRLGHNLGFFDDNDFRDFR